MFWWFLVFVFAVACIMVWAGRKNNQRMRFIDTYLYESFVSPQLRKRIPYVDESQWPIVVKALRQYFRLCYKARGRMVSMPSAIVYELWHEFILDTRSYQVFCQKGFGRLLHHVPAEAMSTPTIAQAGIKRAWHLACSDEDINPQKPTRLPLLFAIDSLLNIPDGFYYSLDCQDRKEENSASGCGGYCATHIGCSSGCGSGDSGCGGGGD